MYSIGKFAKLIGVSTHTLRLWDRSGKLVPLRTNGNQRRYTEEQLNRITQTVIHKRISIGYCRVSSRHQKDDLDRQVELVENFITSKGDEYEIIKDIGSGINYTKNGLKKLIGLVSQNKVDTIYILHKDRLVRFGYELLEEICKKHNTSIVIINKSEEKTDEQEMIEDIMNIIHVFSCRMNGRRSHINKKIAESLTKGIQI